MMFQFDAGHLNVVYAGLIANVVRFITISYLSSPWAVLPFELLQGKLISFSI